MTRKVTTIPARKTAFSGAHLETVTVQRRVAGYARVSTGNEDQATSYEAQVDYYTKYINSRPDWQLVDIYTDEGISGTSTKKRTGFQQMIRDAKAGKIDLIVTKSVSRFARNTVDTLTHVRDLKALGVEIFFEKENIWTLDAKGELLITIMSSLAQEEARSISENVTWGHRKRFAEGHAIIAYANILGYKQGPDKTLVIDETQAPTVRRIYDLFLEGASIKKIATTLEAEGHRTVRGKTRWATSTIRSILTNEKYKGDLLIQKTFTADFLTKEVRPNTGEVPQYYVSEHHEPIIPRETWDLVQYELATRFADRRSKTSLFSSRLKCADCGSWFGQKTWHSSTKYERRVWQCNRKYTQKPYCTSATIITDKLQEMFMQAITKLVGFADGDAVVEYQAELERQLDVTVELAHAEELREKAAELVEQMSALVDAGAKTPDGMAASQSLFNSLEEEHERVEIELAEVEQVIADRQSRLVALRENFRELTSLKLGVGFQPRLVTVLLDCIVVGDSWVEFQFKDGRSVRVA